MSKTQKPLVFLCHSSQDKPVVRELYERLKAEGWMDPWIDEKNLLPGQDWDLQIEKVVEEAAVVIVCLSTNSISKEGYIQRELRYVLNIADEKPEDKIFVIPLRLDDCSVPRRLRMWQYVDYFPDNLVEWGYGRLLESIRFRFRELGIVEDQPITRSKLVVIDKEERKALIDLATEARRQAYAPYSAFSVGAALRAKSGRVFTGSNVENITYSNSVCAERVALFKASSEGEREFDAIAVVSSNGNSPCGSCRQVLAEFGLDIIVLIAGLNGKLFIETTVRELLPAAFNSQDLEQ